MVFDGVGWYLTELNGIPWCSMVFIGFGRDSWQIVLHLLIIGILGYDWDEGPSVGIHPNFIPSQTPTIHPYGFV